MAWRTDSVVLRTSEYSTSSLTAHRLPQGKKKKTKKTQTIQKKQKTHNKKSSE